MEKELAAHSSVLAWRIPGTGEPGGLPFMGLHSVWHNWSDLAAADVFLEHSWFFDDPMDVGKLISCSSAFSKFSLNIWYFTVHVLLKGELVRWVQLCGKLNILWHCLSLGLEWKLTFSSPVVTAEFSNFAGILSAALSQYHHSGFEMAQLEFHHLH